MRFHDAAQEREPTNALLRARIASGEARPLLVHQLLIANFVIPCLYLAVPHVGRPWMYRARLVVVAVVGLLNLDIVRHSASESLAISYVTGVISVWGFIWVCAVLLFSRPQHDAEIVSRRPRPKAARDGGGGDSNASPSASPERVYSSAFASPVAAGNGRDEDVLKRRRKSVRFVVPPDSDVADCLFHREMEYYWQSFPAEAPFKERLGWAYDYYTAWRGAGWNCASSTIPSFQPPQEPHSGELVKIESIPVRSRAGISRPLTTRRLVLTRFRNAVLCYLVLDVCSNLMKKDPYFRTGSHDLAPFPLAAPLMAHPVSRMLLYTYRTTVASATVFSALMAVFSLDQVIRRWLMIKLLGRDVRTELWLYPDTFGPFDQILDHGLAGFWGRSWHQTFRKGLTAPAAWLLGGVQSRTIRLSLTSLVAFSLSGAMHAVGSSTLPIGQARRNHWMPALFFLLAWVGTAVQALLNAVLHLEGWRAGKRAWNLAFTFAWMLLTAWLFLDDLCSAGMWLFEPVPFSFVRALGDLSVGSDGVGEGAAWRWTGPPALIYWHSGRSWWNTGLAV